AGRRCGRRRPGNRYRPGRRDRRDTASSSPVLPGLHDVLLLHHDRRAGARGGVLGGAGGAGREVVAGAGLITRPGPGQGGVAVTGVGAVPVATRIPGAVHERVGVGLAGVGVRLGDALAEPSDHEARGQRAGQERAGPTPGEVLHLAEHTFRTVVVQVVGELPAAVGDARDHGRGRRALPVAAHLFELVGGLPDAAHQLVV